MNQIRLVVNGHRVSVEPVDIRGVACPLKMRPFIVALENQPTLEDKESNADVRKLPCDHC